MKHLFFGGIHPKYNKEMSTKIAEIKSVTPETVVIPMQQHIGAPCRPLVNVGDRVLVGQKIGDGEGLCVPVHASVSGKVIAVEPRPHVSGRAVMAVVIENDKQDERIKAEAYDAPLDKLDNDKVLHIIREAGIVGMGGAAFPGNVRRVRPWAMWTRSLRMPANARPISPPTIRFCAPSRSTCWKACSCSGTY